LERGIAVALSDSMTMNEIPKTQFPKPNSQRTPSAKPQILELRSGFWELVIGNSLELGHWDLELCLTTDH
jgi:hypothetical protein